MAVGSAGEAANGKGVRGSKAAQMHVTALQRRTHVKYDLNIIFIWIPGDLFIILSLF